MNNSFFENIKSIKKILIIQLLPFGDILLSTSYLQALKNKFPEAQIHYLIFKKYKKAIYSHPLIDKVIELEFTEGIKYYTDRIKKIYLIRKAKYDLVIDQQNLPSTQIIALLSKAKYRLGYEDGRFNFAYNIKAKRGKKRYTASKNFDMVAPLGISQEKYDLFFYISDEAKKYVDDWMIKNNLNENSFICISPGSPVNRKKWNINNYINLGKKIYNELKLPLVIVWAPNELQDAKKVVSEINDGSILAPPTDLMQISELVKRSKLLICNDGGLNHLALAAKADSLAIFGPTFPIDWSPADEFKTHHHLFNDEIPYSSNDDTFGISVDNAFDKVKEILSSLK